MEKTLNKGSQKSLNLVVNGKPVSFDLPPETPLLYILRNDLELNGPKYGCGLGECGACTVLVNGMIARSCLVPLGRVENCEITTLEGLGTEANPDIVQQAFIDQQAAQCGYCLNGMVMTTKALLAQDINPSDDKIKSALKHNLCRCGTHVEIINAVKQAATMMQQDAKEESSGELQS